MEKIKQYGLYILIGLFILALISSGVLGYLYGTEKSANKSLREEKKTYQENMATKDSLIGLKERRVVFLTDSFGRLMRDANAENAKADRRIIIVKEDEDEMHEEIDAVHYVAGDSLVRLFNRHADSYEPPR